MRKCSRCSLEKPTSAFWKQSSRRDGLQSACIDCMTQSHKSWINAASSEYKEVRKKLNTEASVRMRTKDPVGLLLASIKYRAKKAGMEFSLTREDIQIPEKCPVFGIPLKFELRRGKGLSEKDCRPSVDRIDNSKGYTKDNIVVVSYRANRIKSDATITELEAVAKFYRGIHEIGCGLVGGNGDSARSLDGQRDAGAVPGMQPVAKEENRPVLERQPQARRNRGALLALRMGSGAAV